MQQLAAAGAIAQRLTPVTLPQHPKTQRSSSTTYIQSDTARTCTQGKVLLPFDSRRQSSSAWPFCSAIRARIFPACAVVPHPALLFFMLIFFTNFSRTPFAATSLSQCGATATLHGSTAEARSWTTNWFGSRGLLPRQGSLG